MRVFFQELPHVAVDTIQEFVAVNEQEGFRLRCGQVLFAAKQGVMYLANLRRVKF
jgi:hypothetical protein